METSCQVRRCKIVSDDDVSRRTIFYYPALIPMTDGSSELVVYLACIVHSTTFVTYIILPLQSRYQEAFTYPSSIQPK